MKKALNTILVLACICISTSAHAADDAYLPGEYKVIAYTLSDGESALGSSAHSSKSISFHSLYISPVAMDTVLNREALLPGESPSYIPNTSYRSFALRGAYSPTSNLSFHSAIGVTDTIDAKNIAYKDRVGWEVDLGMAYRFLNNFAYELHFGYMDTGELFRESNTLTDVDNITIVTNKITMSF